MTVQLRGPKPISCFLGHSISKSVNRKSASGGVVSQMIINHLRSGGLVITPQYDHVALRYKPVILCRAEDYSISASVYHDVDLVNSIKSFNILSNHRYLITCLPCEASFVRNFFNKQNAHVTIVALACSGQQSYDATVMLLKMTGLRVNDVSEIKYRGDGWPSGVQITTTTGAVHTFPNLKGAWYNLFNSQLYTLDKCFTCTDVLGKNADIVCADPWLPEYMKSSSTETSYTLVFARKSIEDYLLQSISLKEIDTDKAILSQKYTISRKERQLRYIGLVRLFLRVRPFFRDAVTANLLVLKIFRILYSKLWKFLPNQN
jgi:coenzyme F420-reducing hydrogenase beta subunit